MQQGISWKEAAATVGIHISRSTVYRWLAVWRVQGDAAFQDSRHGHPAKLRGAAWTFFEEMVKAAPETPSRELQAALYHQFGLTVSIGHLNQVRSHLGLGSRAARRKKTDQRPAPHPPLSELDGAGALLLLAAAQQTGLIPVLEQALASTSAPEHARLTRLSNQSRQMLLLTLLFLGVVDVQRTWDLRSYTGDTLALLTGRPRAYGYGSTERFLADVARSNDAEALTSALARWTTLLWQLETSSETDRLALFYIDGQTPPGLHRYVDPSWSGWTTLNSLGKSNAGLAA